jgi:polysaccharide biosynthesis protein PslH
MDILFLSHCVPYPPNKGEKIRAYHEVMHLAQDHRVHVRCFAKSEAEVADAEALKPHCASVRTYQIGPLAAPTALIRFALGNCLNTSYYHSSDLRRDVLELARETRLGVTIAFCTVMAPFAPPDVPLILDLVDVDSEKWLQYASFRQPSLFYAMEGRRLRKAEIRYGGQTLCVFLSTGQEVALYKSFAPGVRCLTLENGVDFDYYHPNQTPFASSTPPLVFVGMMDYFPNADAVCMFATEVLPKLRQTIADLPFWIVGRSPSPAVQKLASVPGIRVTGAVDDVRPYVAAARAVVAPLRIARGIQNKVLEALAMDKPVLASKATALTFGDSLPCGVTRCETPVDYLRALMAPGLETGDIRKTAQSRFVWSAALAPLLTEARNLLSP